MPYCPTCRTEYGSQIELCNVCNVRLVSELPDDSGDDEGIELVELAQFTNVSEAEMIREILEANEIQTIQRGEVDPIAIASRAEPIALLVEERCLPKARELFDAYYAGAGIEPSQSDQE